MVATMLAMSARTFSVRSPRWAGTLLNTQMVVPVAEETTRYWTLTVSFSVEC